MRALSLLFIAVLLCACRPEAEGPDAPPLQPVVVVYHCGTWSSQEEVYAPRIAIYNDGRVLVRRWVGLWKNTYVQGQLSEAELSGLLDQAKGVFADPDIEDYYELEQAYDYPSTFIELHAGGLRASKELYGAGLDSITRNAQEGLRMDERLLSLPTGLKQLLLRLYQTENQCQEPWSPTFDDRHVPQYPCAAALAGPANVRLDFAPYFRAPVIFEGEGSVRQQVHAAWAEYQAGLNRRYGRGIKVEQSLPAPVVRPRTDSLEGLPVRGSDDMTGGRGR